MERRAEEDAWTDWKERGEGEEEKEEEGVGEGEEEGEGVMERGREEREEKEKEKEKEKKKKKEEGNLPFENAKNPKQLNHTTNLTLDLLSTKKKKERFIHSSKPIGKKRTQTKEKREKNVENPPKLFRPFIY